MQTAEEGRGQIYAKFHDATKLARCRNLASRNWSQMRCNGCAGLTITGSGTGVMLSR